MNFLWIVLGSVGIIVINSFIISIQGNFKPSIQANQCAFMAFYNEAL